MRPDVHPDDASPALAGIESVALPSVSMTAGSPSIPTTSTSVPAVRRRGWRPGFWLMLVLLLAGLGAALWFELRTSELQSIVLGRYARTLSYEVAPGPSPSQHFPTGPYDTRLGYARIPAFSEQLWAQGFRVESQARFSAPLLAATAHGITPPYPEKTNAGLLLLGAHDEPLYSFMDPSFTYPSFEAVPDLVLRSLLYVENRELLDTERPYANPAIEWDRLARALYELGERRLGASDGNVPGGSTLATQIEKYRHSPGGLTSDPLEKLRQIASASLRAYRGGRDTTSVRRELALAYLNTIPLAATPQWGEVFGLGDALHAHYDADPARVSALLASAPTTPEAHAERGLAYRQVLSLLISSRRPSELLHGGPSALNDLTAQYLRRMADDGVISPALRDDALAQPLAFAAGARDVEAIAAGKGVTRMRAWLGATLGASPYELDRLDLSVATTLDAGAQADVTQRLRELADPEAVARLGLRQKNALGEGDDPGRVVYAFTLYERTPEGNSLRVHADSLGSELDVNDGIKLDLGSTAKLRTLVTYLEVLAELHTAHAGESPESLAAGAAAAADPITRFVLGRLAGDPSLSLDALLEAGLDRRYSASPYESFFTGGGLHRFANFDSDDDGRVLAVREAFRRSVNLPFVRLMRDLARFESAPLAQNDFAAELLRYADREGRMLLVGRLRKWEGLDREAILNELVARGPASPRRVATILRSANPAGDADWFAAELGRRSPAAAQLEPATVRKLYANLGPDVQSLSDRGWLARTEPLDLWLAGYLWDHPHATRDAVIAASADARIEASAWLFRTRNERALERRLAELHEQDAFAKIHERWARLGYPFPTLVPSYATAIGSSADRPAALAELMGIVLANGVRLPERRVEHLDFARGTPYETTLTASPPPPQQVLRVEVARVVRAALADVVANGTARRVGKTFAAPDGSTLVLAGKTGTGDHRYKTFGPGGVKTSERILNRTAVFAFIAGDHHFGVVTAYVAGPAAAEYRFTSALPLEVLRALAPAIAPLLGAQVAPPPAPPAPTVALN